jgi:hypothetical protein
MSITPNLNRRSVGLNVTKLDVQRSVREAYIRVIEKRSTTKEATEQVHWLMFQLVLLVVQRIDVSNLSGLS